MIRDLINSYRKIRGLSLQKLAEETRIPFTVLWRLEKNKPINEKHWLRLLKWMFSTTEDK